MQEKQHDLPMEPTKQLKEETPFWKKENATSRNSQNFLNPLKAPQSLNCNRTANPHAG